MTAWQDGDNGDYVTIDTPLQNPRTRFCPFKTRIVADPLSSTRGRPRFIAQYGYFVADRFDELIQREDVIDRLPEIGR
jgi:hypothetical protein